MSDNKLRQWGVGFLGGAYAVALALLYVLLLRSVAVQIAPPPTPLNEPYPDTSTEELCEEAGGRWVTSPGKAIDRPAPVTENGEPQPYCQGPLRFEREREQQRETSQQTTVYVFALGGALAAAAGALCKKSKVLSGGLILAGIVSFFIAGINLWSLVPGIGRLITIIVLFGVLVGIGWYAFREQHSR